MKFIASTSAILKQLSSVVGVIPSNPLVPILENFLFEIRNGLLTITASDLQTSVITELNVEADANASIAVPAKMLIDTLKNLPEQPVTFTIDQDSYSIEISSDNGRYKLSGEAPGDFPRAPKIDRLDEVEFPSDLLADAISYTIFATSSDEMKPAMNGVHIGFTEEHTNFVSSDSHRLIRYRRTDLKAKYDAAMIIHKKALDLLRKMLPSERTSVKMEFNASNAIFSFNNYKVICRLIDERFPDYENVIPVNNNNVITIGRSELLSTLKRIVIYANKTTNQIRLKIAGGELRVSAEDLDFSNEAHERLACEHDGDELEIGFNARFLIEMLNNLHSDKIIIKFNTPGSAGLMIPSESSEDEDILMLVMPIMLHNYV